MPGADAFQRSFGRNYGELASQREQRGPPQRLARALCLENPLPARHPAMRRSLPSAQWQFAMASALSSSPPAEIPAFLIISYRLDQLEWIGVMRRLEPGHRHVEFAFIQCE